MRVNPLQGPLEELGHESLIFLGPETARAKQELFGPKKLRLSWPNPSNGPSIVFAPINHITYRAISIKGP